MKAITRGTFGVGLMALVAAAGAQPAVTSLGGGVPVSVTNNLTGSIYVGGALNSSATRWTLSNSGLTIVENGGTGSAGYMSSNGQVLIGSWLNTAPQLFGNTAANVSPAFSPTPTLVTSTTLPAATEFVARRFSFVTNSWNQLGTLPIVGSELCFGSSSSGQSSGSFLTGFGVSADGRFICGQAYVCTYNSAGTTVSANSFRWRPWLWDADGNAGAGKMILLPTPNRTTSTPLLKRTGIAYDVSADGSVVVGATEHNVSGSGDDSSRLCVWRLNTSTNAYELTYLPLGGGLSSTASGVAMNDAGTIIAARTNDGVSTFIAKWVWNGTAWDPPVSLGTNLSSPASWLPAAVLSCTTNQPVPLPNIGSSLAMSEDGSVVVGSAIYSTCGSFMSGGFIWRQSTGLMQDWYDFLLDAGAPGVEPNGIYGPIGDFGDPAKGLPRIGFPTAISADGTNVTCFQGGTQRIIGAVPTLVQLAPTVGGCSNPVITLNPSNATFTRCSTLILNAAAAGTGPISYQWQKGGVNVNDGTTVDGTVITGAATQQMRITNGHPTDAGSYACVITGACGSRPSPRPPPTSRSIPRRRPWRTTPAPQRWPWQRAHSTSIPAAPTSTMRSARPAPPPTATRGSSTHPASPARPASRPAAARTTP